MKIKNQEASRNVRDRNARTINRAPEVDPWYNIRLPQPNRPNPNGGTVAGSIVGGIPHNSRAADLRGRGRGDE